MSARPEEELGAEVDRLLAVIEGGVFGGADPATAAAIEAPEGYLGAEGRLGSGPSPALVDAGYRLEVADARILHEGLCLADLAHVLELVDAEVAPRRAAARLCRVLLDFLSTPVESFPYDPLYGDAYNSRERELERRIGAAAGWLPTGRTRREAGRLAIRLALRSRILDLHTAVAGLATRLVQRALELASVPWNDTTYLQPAQPSSFGYYLAGFAEQAIRDLQRVRSCHRWANLSPGGSGGVGGTSIPLSRGRISDRLGFRRPTRHIRDGMWSADGMVDCTVAATQAVMNADRLAEDLEVFATPQFGYVALGGSSSRASVLLPQKRNPYALAVIRGGCGTLIGRSTGLMSTQRTPSARTDNWLYAYGEVTGSVELAGCLLRLAADVVTTMEVDVGRLADSAGDNFTTATDLTELLVLERGLDYRSAYRIVGRAVANVSEREGTRVAAVDLERAAGECGIDLSGLSSAVERAGDVDALISSRGSPGGSAPNRVAEHCGSVLERVRGALEWAQAARHAHESATTRLLAEASALAER